MKGITENVKFYAARIVTDGEHSWMWRSVSPHLTKEGAEKDTQILNEDERLPSDYFVIKVTTTERVERV